jgi:hypothetical protein
MAVMHLKVRSKFSTMFKRICKYFKIFFVCYLSQGTKTWQAVNDYLNLTAEDIANNFVQI